MKHAREMTPEERAAALAELKRGPKPEPDISKTAKDMTKVERREWLAEHKRRVG